VEAQRNTTRDGRHIANSATLALEPATGTSGEFFLEAQGSSLGRERISGITGRNVVNRSTGCDEMLRLKYPRVRAWSGRSRVLKWQLIDIDTTIHPSITMVGSCSSTTGLAAELFAGPALASRALVGVGNRHQTHQTDVGPHATATL
jgi:hypothetical protein